MGIDFGRTAGDYGRHRLEYPPRLFEQLLARGVGVAGQRVLDVGTGAGNLARGFASRGCEVVGLDASEALLEEARRIDAERAVHVEYVAGQVERLHFEPDSFDVVSAGDAWGWVDGSKALREIRRVLRATGAFVIAQFDALPLRNNPVEATEKLVEKYNSEWAHAGGTGLHPKWLTQLRQAGFRDLETFSFDLTLTMAQESWRGFVRAGAGVKASLAADEAARFDERLRSTLIERFGDADLDIPFCCWAVCARAPA